MTTAIASAVLLFILAAFVGLAAAGTPPWLAFLVVFSALVVFLLRRYYRGKR